MTFKDDIAQDAAEVFFNLDEFAELVEIDGIKIPAIISKHTANLEFQNLGAKNHIHPERHNQPLIGKYMTVYFPTADYVKARGRIPKNSEYCRVQGERYRVESTIDELGVTKLELSTDSMNTPTAPQGVRLPSLYD